MLEITQDNKNEVLKVIREIKNNGHAKLYRNGGSKKNRITILIYDALNDKSLYFEQNKLFSKVINYR